MAAKPFVAGDRVAHSAREAYKHGGKSIVRVESVVALDPTAFLGTVVAAANEVGTIWIVKVDKSEAAGELGGQTREFTADSLVKIEE